MNVPRFCPTSGDLCCPACGGGNLHQFAVDVGFRKKEDEPDSLLVHVDVSGAKLAQGSVHGRRDALHISFWCEHCPDKPTLTVRQHKGCTEIFWVPVVAKKVVK